MREVEEEPSRDEEDLARDDELLLADDPLDVEWVRLDAEGEVPEEVDPVKSGRLGVVEPEWPVVPPLPTKMERRILSSRRFRCCSYRSVLRRVGVRRVRFRKRRRVRPLSLERAFSSRRD